MLSAVELHQRGLAASNAARYARARGLFEKALERSESGEQSARVLLSLAHVDSELSGREAGLERCDDALAIEGLSPQLVGLIQSQRGLLLGRSGLADAALDAFAQAQSLLDDDNEALMRLHLNRGNVYLMRSDASRASRDFERAVQHAEHAGLDVQTAKARYNLGYARLLTGDLVSALQMMDLAKPTLAALSVTSAAVCEQDRAEVLAASGMVTDAAAALRDAAAAFGSRGLRHQQAEAEFVLARLLVLEDPADALRVARRADRRFGRRGSEGWALRSRAVAVAAEIEAGGSSTELLERADALIAELDRHGLRNEAAGVRLRSASAAARRGELASATRRVEAAHVTSSQPLSIRLLARETRADLARRRGRPWDAVRHLRSGLAELHDWQSSFGSLDLQSSLVGHGRGLALQGLSLAVDDGRPSVVFEWAERARALATRVSPLRPPAEQQAAADLADLRHLQIDINAAEARGVVPKSMLTRAQRLRATIRQHGWYGEGSRIVTEPAGLDEAVEIVAASDGALLSYLVVEGTVYALVVTGDEAVLVGLGPFAAVRTLLDGLQADMDMTAARLPAAIAGSVRAALDQRLARLADILVSPVRDRLGERRLVIVPSGSLAGIPWSLLTGIAGSPLTVPRSMTAWLRTRESDAGSSRAGFVAGPRVARAEEEVARASAPWADADVLGGDRADAAAVRSLAASVDVFHVAAHGRHSADNPLFSGLELADGPWFGYDIDQLERIPSTVVLSACEVGRSSVRWGEEAIGMTVAWLHAGARCVIASPALVNDDAACEVLSSTHALLARGADPSDALASAVSRAAADAPPTPFLCFGNGW